MQKSIEHNSRTTNTFDNQIVKHQVRSALNIYIYIYILLKHQRNIDTVAVGSRRRMKDSRPSRPIRIPNEKSKV